jgi:cysteine synthase
MIVDAERRGILRPGATIIEPTGGNTGIGLAFAGATRGYRLILTMPETMSAERVALLTHLGAEVILTPGILMTDAVARAEQLASEVPGGVMLDQFRNPANPEVHRETTVVALGRHSRRDRHRFGGGEKGGYVPDEGSRPAWPRGIRRSRRV